MKFRKKPLIVEAITCADAIFYFQNYWDKLPKWLQDHYDKGGITVTYGGIYIKTLEGEMLAGVDDWIICGVMNEIYPCKKDIFERTYERVIE